ncbi:MAG: hypothetical protein Q7R41_13860, partial [Phycisphaerales bacterium]|nr:hypothetical protein [Phycisphaerales bacterium]
FTRRLGERVHSRLGLVVLIAAIAAIAAFMPATASADLSSTLDQTFSDPSMGAHSTYTNVQEFTPSEAAPHDDNDDLRKWILDSPAGQFGNPNAIPFAERCTLTQFTTTVALGGGLFTTACPASSIVGAAAVRLQVDANDATADGNGAAPNIGSFAALNPSFADSTGIPASVYTSGTPGTIYLLQTTPEVPTTLATFFHLTTTRTQSVLQPVTSGADGDFRIRVIPVDDSAHPVGAGPTPLYVGAIMQRLHGLAPNGQPFLTNPTRCDNWDGYSYAREYDAAGNTNADSTPDIENPANGYKKSPVDTVTPTCTTPKFAPTASVTFSKLDRDTNPQVDFIVNSGAVPGDDYPKKVVTTMPASVTTDLQGVANLCEVANRDAGNCPAASWVGIATVETPLLTAGLSGDVYIVRSSDAIPDLAIYFNNPPNSIRSFRMDGTTKFVGTRGNQIETTFDNGPQTPFTKFTVTIAGGTDTLLTISKCPDGTASPEDGPVSFAMTGFSGQATSTATTPVFSDCFGLSKLKKISKCVKRKLRVSPSYQSRSMLMKSELWIKRHGTKRYKMVQRVKKSPFRFSKKLSRSIRKGGHKYKVRAVYNPTGAHPTPQVFQRYSHFKKC